MAQVIRGKPGIGAAFGTGLAGGLNALADAKIKQMIEAPQQQAFASALSAILGANPEEVQQDENILQQAAGQTPATHETQQTPTQAQQPSMQPKFKSQSKLVESLKKGGVSKEDFFRLAGLEQQKQLRSAEQAKQARKEAHTAQKEIDARTQPFYDKVIEGEKAAKEVKHTLTKLKKLDEKGDVPPAVLYNSLHALESIGPKEGSIIGSGIGAALGGYAGAGLAGPLGALIGGGAGLKGGEAIGGALGAAMKPLTTLFRAGLIGLYPDTEEFEKTSLEFLKNVRPLIGGHVTENQLDLFIKAIPTLATTAHGRKQIINNMGVIAEGSTALYDATEEVIRDNGGKRPSDFEFKVMRLADEKRKEYAKRWQD